MLNLEIKKYTDDMQEKWVSSVHISRAMDFFTNQRNF